MRGFVVPSPILASPPPRPWTRCLHALAGGQCHGTKTATPTHDHIAHTRAALADFVHVRADWRAEKARQWPEDPRNARSADALRALESWVLALPASDERLRRLAAHYPEDIAFLPAGDGAAHFVSRYGYSFVANPDRFLGVFVVLVAQEDEARPGLG